MTTILAPGRTDDVRYAEMAVLGTIITARPAAEAALEVLDTDDCFSIATHQAVAAAVRHLTETGGPLGQAAVLARLIAAETGIWHTGSAGGIITDLVRHASPSWATDVQTVHRAALQRRTLDALTSAGQIAGRPGFDAATDGELIRDRIETALTGTRRAGAAPTAAALFNDAVDRLSSPDPPGMVTFPWEALRDLVPWLRPGQLVTIAARPSLGKSTAGQDLARHAALRLHLPVALFTMEMDRAQVMDRLLAAEAKVPFERIATRTLRETDWDRIAAVRDRFADVGDLLVIDDTPRVSLAHARARLRGMARTAPPQLAIFDYLQLMDPPKAENRQQEVAALVAGLKETARGWGIPVVMLAQLNRGVEARSDRRPYLSDARESGAIENESDVAILIHRPDFHAAGTRPGEADLIVDKNRDGKRGTATVGFQGRYVRFVDLAWEPAPPRQSDPVVAAEAARQDYRDELGKRRQERAGGAGDPGVPPF